MSISSSKWRLGKCNWNLGICWGSRWTYGIYISGYFFFLFWSFFDRISNNSCTKKKNICQHQQRFLRTSISTIFWIVIRTQSLLKRKDIRMHHLSKLPNKGEWDITWAATTIPILPRSWMARSNLNSEFPVL